MKNFSLWIPILVGGLLFMVLLNTSPLARLDLSYEPPFGWHNAPLQIYHDCTLQDGKDPNLNHCDSPCVPSHQHDDGIPFATKRQNSSSNCFQDTNPTSVWLNYLLGIVIGFIVIFLLERAERQ